LTDLLGNIQDTAANLAATNPIIGSGKAGIEIDTNQYKLGDGNTAWNDLPYVVRNA